MSTLELAAVLFLLLLTLGMIFAGARAYKSGVDRAVCLLNIYNAQNAVRSYGNLRGFTAGETVSPEVNLEAAIFADHEFAGTPPACPAGGSYATLGNVIPEFGQFYLTCSLSTGKSHRPEKPRRW